MSRGGRPGLQPPLIICTISVDVKQHGTRTSALSGDFLRLLALPSTNNETFKWPAPQPVLNDAQPTSNLMVTINIAFGFVCLW